MKIEIWDSRTKELIDTVFIGNMSKSYSLNLLLSGREYPRDLTLQIVSAYGKTYVFPPHILEHLYFVESVA